MASLSIMNGFVRYLRKQRINRKYQESGVLNYLVINIRSIMGHAQAAKMLPQIPNNFFGA